MLKTFIKRAPAFTTRTAIFGLFKRYGILGRVSFYWVKLWPGQRLEKQQQFKKSEDLLSDLHRLRPAFPTAGSSDGTVLVPGFSEPHLIAQQSIPLGALVASGYRPMVVLTGPYPWSFDLYRAMGIDRIVHFGDLVPARAPLAGEAAINTCSSVEDFVNFEWNGIRLGRFAASSLVRKKRIGALDIGAPALRNSMGRQLELVASHAIAAMKIQERFNPRIALLSDRGYTPEGVFFDCCLAAGGHAITWNLGPRGSTHVLKRYSVDNRDDHFSSLSDKSWNLLCALKWTHERSRRITDEIRMAYEDQSWFSQVGTQFNTIIFDESSIRKRLRLSAEKKTVVVFPHIFWDGAFFWGKDLFSSFEEWFVKTVEAAIENDRVEWIIKVHPANVTKDARDRVAGESSELRALKRFGQLPPHIKVIPASSDISALSILRIADYCLTVRGTPGLEGAAFGKRVITAGSGRYDGKGFTMDPTTPEEYLSLLQRIEDVSSPSQGEITRAQRFAFGVFIARPLPITSLQINHLRDATVSTEVKFLARRRQDFLRSQEVVSVTEWIGSGDADFLNPAVIAPERRDAPSNIRPASA